MRIDFKTAKLLNIHPFTGLVKRFKIEFIDKKVMTIMVFLCHIK